MLEHKLIMKTKGYLYLAVFFIHNQIRYAKDKAETLSTTGVNITIQFYSIPEVRTYNIPLLPMYSERQIDATA